MNEEDPINEETVLAFGISLELCILVNSKGMVNNIIKVALIVKRTEKNSQQVNRKHLNVTVSHNRRVLNQL